MNGQISYVLVGGLAVVAVVIGSLLLAAGIDDDGGGVFGRVFLSSLGAALALFGIGAGVASAATFLARRQ